MSNHVWKFVPCYLSEVVASKGHTYYLTVGEYVLWSTLLSFDIVTQVN